MQGLYRKGVKGMKAVKTIFFMLPALVAMGITACTGGDLKITSTFDNADGNSGNGLFSVYSGANDSLWTYAADPDYPDTLRFTSSMGGKVLFTGSQISTGTVEADITLTDGTDTGNAGFTVYSSKYSDGGSDSLHGIYVGLGRNNGANPISIDGVEVGSKATFLQIGQMQDNWKQLGLARLSDGPVEYPITCHLAINMTGEGIQILVDGVQKGKFMPDPEFMAGGAVGFRTFNAAGFIDNLSITGTGLAKAEEPDPSRISAYAMSYGETPEGKLRVSFNVVNKTSTGGERAFVLALYDGGTLLKTEEAGSTIDAQGERLFYADFDAYSNIPGLTAKLYTQDGYAASSPAALRTLDIGIWRSVVSATTLTTANHGMTGFDHDKYTFRTFIKPTQDYGDQTWQFFFSNIFDFTGGVEAGTPFRITEAFIADGGKDGNGSVVAGSSVRITYGGQIAKDVAAGEQFWSDEAKLSLPEGNWLCFTWTVQPLDPYRMENARVPIASQTFAKTYFRNTNDTDNVGFASQENGNGYEVFGDGGWGIMPNMFGVKKTVARRISFMGDSITHGIGTPRGNRDTENYWVANIAKGFLQNPATGDFAIYNVALSGSLGRDAAKDGAWLARLKQDDEITLVHGVNDLGQGATAESFIALLKKEIDAIRLSNPKADITLFTVPAWAYDETQTAYWREINRWIMDRPQNVSYVFDMAGVLEDPDNPPNVKMEYRADGLFYDQHPGTVGCAAIADAYLKWYAQRDRQ